LAALRTTLLAAVLAVALAGCTPSGVPDWTGGPVSPSPLTLDPIAGQAGDAIPTGLLVEKHELILYFLAGSGDPHLAATWRDTGTGKVSPWDPIYDAIEGGDIGEASTSPVFQLNQYVPGDGTVIEYGGVVGPAARIVSRNGDEVTEARFARWSRDPSISIFWLRRRGLPIPPNTHPDEAHSVPLAPERYPLISAYDKAGHLIGSARLRPSGTELKGG
jgi:hypothetical protein